MRTAYLRPSAFGCAGRSFKWPAMPLPRPTGDVDYIAAIPRYRMEEFEKLAARESKLEAKYKVHVQHVTVAALPENYEDRLKEIFPGRFKKLTILAPDPSDLVLSKLERNSPKDQAEVEYLVKTAGLDPKVLRDRYERELRPNLMARQTGMTENWIYGLEHIFRATEDASRFP
jgi:hypothetical protein